MAQYNCLKGKSAILKIQLYITACLLISFSQSWAQARLVLSGNVVLNIHGGASESNAMFVVVDNSNANAISSSGNGRIHSEGEFNVLRWNISNGTGNYIVPFGDAADALPITVAISSAGSTGGRIDFSTYPTGDNNLPMPVGVNSLDHQDIIGDGQPAPAGDGAKVYDRYWLTKTGSSYNSLPQGDLSFTYKAAGMTNDLVFGTTPLAAQFHNGTSWSLSQFGADDNNGLVSGVTFSNTSFGSVWALVQNGAPLPITLLSFNAVWEDSRQSEARIFWSTASEENNDYFDVERSADGNIWQKIDRVQGAGTSTYTLYYETFDKNPLDGIAYYRLKQVDFDGTVSYSHVVSLKREINEAAISVYPNPANDQFQVAFEGFKSSEVNINILDNAGRIVITKSNNVVNNPVQIINTAGLQSGVYYIHVSSDAESFVEKIIIKN